MNKKNLFLLKDMDQDSTHMVVASKVPMLKPEWCNLAKNKPQTVPIPRPSPSTTIPDSIPESSGGNHGGFRSSKEIQQLKAHIKKLKKQAKPVVTHHRAWMKSVSLKHRLAGKRSLKKQWMQRESWFDGRRMLKDVIPLPKDAISNVQQKVSTDKEKVSTERPHSYTDRPDEGIVDQTEGRSATLTTPTPTLITFGDDETIAQVILNISQAKAVSREKEKGVELKDIEENERPRPTSTRSLLTLKPLLKIDPKDKGKKKIEEEDESDTESEGIPEAKKKFKQLARDEKMARKVQEDWKAEEEVKRLAEEEAIKSTLSNEYNFIQARIEADRLLALRLQDEERERAVHSIAIRNRPPTRTQLRNQMMTYLKHVGNKKHSDLKNKTFEEIQALYEKVKRFDESFTAIGSTEDERKEEDIAKVPAKVEITEQGTKKRKGGHMKMIVRKRKRPPPDVNSDDEHRKCLKIVTLEGSIDSEIMENKSFIARLNKVSSPDGDYLVLYRANRNFRAFNYLMEIVTWRLYEACGVCILELEDGTVIHMLVERRLMKSDAVNGLEFFTTTTQQIVISSPCLTGIRTD
ncbi:hypothetical protein Tco_0930636 [Tanacetum coccineum]